MSEPVKPLAIVVPSRSRPQNVARMVEAWRNTGALGVADLIWAIDRDDPTFGEYVIQFAGRGAPEGVSAVTLAEWFPMVAKLNAVAGAAAGGYKMVGFMGDDHVPRSNGWAQTFVETLRTMGTGIVYGDDLFQREHLPTHWAMTSNIVVALDRMVPAPVDHLFCDNSVLALGKALHAITYRGDVVIEHCHPMAGKGEPDPQYERVNSDVQNRADRTAYTMWLGAPGGFAADVERVRAECGLS